MDRLIWTAVSGMNASMARQRMIASNMANAQTPGFRAEVMANTPMTIDGQSIAVRSMADASVYGAQMDAGTFIGTGRPLDIAVQGEALLTVQGTDGQEAYTRRGDLAVSPTGLLVNGDGLPMMGDSGPISVPPGSNVTITPEGAVMAKAPGDDPAAPPQQIDKLKLVSRSGSTIAKGLDGQFRVVGGGVLPQDQSAAVVSGTLEGSNVKPAAVLVQMVEAQRLYDMRTKLIATAKELDEGGASLMRMT